ncbi:MAG: hypothetical protein WKI04_01845 [Ferruginibacter sp.]
MIPSPAQAFHVSGLSKAKGKGNVLVSSPKPALSSGVFHIDMNVSFDPEKDIYPAGTLSIQTDLGDGNKGIFIASTFELINAFAKQDPIIYLTGQCKSNVVPAACSDSCRYWVMIVNNTRNNHRTPDIVGFCIHDCNGNRVAYGTSLYGNTDATAN